MKVALLLFGQPRNIDNPNSFNSHQKWIFDEYDVDTFCHAWWDEDVSEYDVSDWVGETMYHLRQPYRDHRESL